jgi:hypothetical protein
MDFPLCGSFWCHLEHLQFCMLHIKMTSPSVHMQQQKWCSGFQAFLCDRILPRINQATLIFIYTEEF